MGFKPPSNLLNWAKIRRDRAQNYLKNKNSIEMISITSAIVGRKIFEQQQVPVFKLIRFPANFRWEKGVFNAGLENLIFKVSRNLIEKMISKKKNVEYDPFTRKIVLIND